MNLSVIYTKRETKDIFEDYDLGLYSNPNGDTEGGQADENSDFYLPYSYFGYDSAPPFNYVIGTLKGGERKYQGLQVTLQKQKSNNWQGMRSEEHTSELQSLMRISFSVFCLKKKNKIF